MNKIIKIAEENKIPEESASNWRTRNGSMNYMISKIEELTNTKDE